jgi:folate-dependent phosphoribosylglycinamide formyltransferase PurN
LDIGWFSTGRDAAARELLSIAQKNIDTGVINGKIIFSFSNRGPGEHSESDLFFDLVNDLKIPLITYSSQAFNKVNNINDIEKHRILFDKQVMNKISQFKPDICVLAGYMLIVGEEMCNQYDMINLHPALPSGPKGSWQEVIWELIEKKESTSGVMMHLATPDLDRGPVISYCEYPIRGELLDKYWGEIGTRTIHQVKAEEGENNKLFTAIRGQGLLREFPLIILTLKSLCDKDVQIVNKTVIDRTGNTIKGYDLTSQVNSMIGL